MEKKNISRILKHIDHKSQSRDFERRELELQVEILKPREIFKGLLIPGSHTPNVWL